MFLDATEETYNQDPSLSIHSKKIKNPLCGLPSHAGETGADCPSAVPGNGFILSSLLELLHEIK
jgi:hypothetical protein